LTVPSGISKTRAASSWISHFGNKVKPPFARTTAVN
jgi:hypothetical protein